MTPSDIEVLLHYNVSASPHPRAHALAVKDAIRMFLAADILEYAPKGYSTTTRGAALVKALCKVPFPERRWVDERGEVL